MKSAIGRAQDLEGDGWLETTEVTMNGGKFDMMIRLFALGNFRRQALANHSLCDQRPHPDKHELETPAMQRIVFRQRPRGTSQHRAAAAALALLLTVALAFGGEGAVVASAAAKPKPDPAPTARDNDRQRTDTKRRADRAPATERTKDDTADGPRGRAIKTFTNSARITIPSVGTASPYPSTIQVRGLDTSITDVNVTLHNFAHPFADDVDVLLVGPQGQTVVIMSDAGGSSNITNLTLNVDDKAALPMPDAVPPFPTTGSVDFQPTNGTGQGTESYPPPAPPNPGPDSELSSFDGTNPNGSWRLFVGDDVDSFSGRFEGGWSLEITTANGKPRANPDRFTARAGKTLRRNAPGVLANGRDLDGDALVVKLVKRTRHGTVQLRANGAFIYKPEQDFRGKDALVYQVRDGSGLTDRAKVTLKVKGKRR